MKRIGRVSENNRINISIFRVCNIIDRHNGFTNKRHVFFKNTALIINCFLFRFLRNFHFSHFYLVMIIDNRIISNHTKNTSENCYKDLNEYRNALIISLNSAGANLQTNSTVNDIAVAAKDLNTDIEKLAQIISEDTDGKIKECYKNLNEYRKDMIESLNKSGADISENANIEAISEQVKAGNIEITKGKEEIADAITSKGIETTSKDSLSNMAEKIKQIQTAGYGVSGYIDAIIETSGGIVAIYGLYTAEEQEAS